MRSRRPGKPSPEYAGGHALGKVRDHGEHTVRPAIWDEAGDGSEGDRAGEKPKAHHRPRRRQQRRSLRDFDQQIKGLDQDFPTRA